MPPLREEEDGCGFMVGALAGGGADGCVKWLLMFNPGWD
jgi:hypothetical protein